MTTVDFTVRRVGGEESIHLSNGLSGPATDAYIATLRHAELGRARGNGMRPPPMCSCQVSFLGTSSGGSRLRRTRITRPRHPISSESSWTALRMTRSTTSRPENCEWREGLLPIRADDEAPSSVNLVDANGDGRGTSGWSTSTSETDRATQGPAHNIDIPTMWSSRGWQLDLGERSVPAGVAVEKQHGARDAAAVVFRDHQLEADLGLLGHRREVPVNVHFVISEQVGLRDGSPASRPACGPVRIRSLWRHR